MEMLVDLADQHGPCSVRHLFYQALVAKVPGIDKSSGYDKVQPLILKGRREGLIPYEAVVDNTRWMRKPRTWGSPEEALTAVAQTYRRDLWRTSWYRVEVWCESDSIASTVHDVTAKWDVPLMICKGYSSETFAYNAADAWRDDHRIPVVLYVGDHDKHGLNIERVLRNRLSEFSECEPEWQRIGVSWEQVEELDLPGSPPKEPYGFPLAVEAEALPPRLLRSLLDQAIEEYVDERKLEVLLVAEESERQILLKMAGVAC